MVSSPSGLIQRIQWDGSVNDALTIVLDSVPFSVDFPQSKSRMQPSSKIHKINFQFHFSKIKLFFSPESYLSSSSVHVIDLDYSFLLGGFSLVLSNGRGALMTASHSEFLPDTVQCVWVPPEPCPFTCTAVNHKYRLMAFGCAK
jgi:RAB6A-GEF complex partner protein 1